MCEKRAFDLSHEDYLKSGGRFDSRSLDIAKNIWSTIIEGQKVRVSEVSLKQTILFARCCPEIEPEQKYLYASLREIEVRGKDGGLGDQELFAETLLLTGDLAKRESFINQFPHIFK